MPRTVSFRAEVRDDIGNVTVLQAQGIINEPPVGQGIDIQPAEVPLGGQAVVTVLATDPEGRPLSYSLPTVSEGGIIHEPADPPNIFRYTAPSV